MAHYRIEATNAGAVVSMETPLAAAKAYSRSVQLRQLGFIAITAIKSQTGRRITDVRRKLRDLEE